jgi:DNA-binding NarL/FixJ family response regulator
MQSAAHLYTPAHRIRILIVDDIPPVRQGLHLLLDLTGELEVVGEAVSGADAITQAEAQHPQVILMDLLMPKMDGFEASRQIKARLPDCRVVAFSVHGYPQVRQKARESGMDGFIEKGTPLPEILHIIHRVVNADPIS